MTHEIVAINVGPDGNDAAGRPVPPQGPTGPRPAPGPWLGQPPAPAEILENGPARRHDPEPDLETAAAGDCICP